VLTTVSRVNAHLLVLQCHYPISPNTLNSFAVWSSIHFTLLQIVIIITTHIIFWYFMLINLFSSNIILYLVYKSITISILIFVRKKDKSFFFILWRLSTTCLTSWNKKSFSKTLLNKRVRVFEFSLLDYVHVYENQSISKIGDPRLLTW